MRLSDLVESICCIYRKDDDIDIENYCSILKDSLDEFLNHLFELNSDSSPSVKQLEDFIVSLRLIWSSSYHSFGFLNIVKLIYVDIKFITRLISIGQRCSVGDMDILSVLHYYSRFCTDVLLARNIHADIQFCEVLNMSSLIRDINKCFFFLIEEYCLRDLVLDSIWELITCFVKFDPSTVELARVMFSDSQMRSILLKLHSDVVESIALMSSSRNETAKLTSYISDLMYCSYEIYELKAKRYTFLHEDLMSSSLCGVTLPLACIITIFQSSFSKSNDSHSTSNSFSTFQQLLTQYHNHFFLALSKSGTDIDNNDDGRKRFSSYVEDLCCALPNPLWPSSLIILMAVLSKLVNEVRTQLSFSSKKSSKDSAKQRDISLIVFYFDKISNIVESIVEFENISRESFSKLFRCFLTNDQTKLLGSFLRKSNDQKVATANKKRKLEKVNWEVEKKSYFCSLDVLFAVLHQLATVQNLVDVEYIPLEDNWDYFVNSCVEYIGYSVKGDLQMKDVMFFAVLVYLEGLQMVCDTIFISNCKRFHIFMWVRDAERSKNFALADNIRQLLEGNKTFFSSASSSSGLMSHHFVSMFARLQCYRMATDTCRKTYDLVLDASCDLSPIVRARAVKCLRSILVGRHVFQFDDGLKAASRFLADSSISVREESVRVLGLAINEGFFEFIDILTHGLFDEGFSVRKTTINVLRDIVMLIKDPLVLANLSIILLQRLSDRSEDSSLKESYQELLEEILLGSSKDDCVVISPNVFVDICCNLYFHQGKSVSNDCRQMDYFLQGLINNNFSTRYKKKVDSASILKALGKSLVQRACTEESFASLFSSKFSNNIAPGIIALQVLTRSFPPALFGYICDVTPYLWVDNTVEVWEKNIIYAGVLDILKSICDVIDECPHTKYILIGQSDDLSSRIQWLSLYEGKLVIEASLSCLMAMVSSSIISSSVIENLGNKCFETLKRPIVLKSFNDINSGAVQRSFVVLGNMCKNMQRSFLRIIPTKEDIVSKNEIIATSKIVADSQFSLIHIYGLCFSLCMTFLEWKECPESIVCKVISVFGDICVGCPIFAVMLENTTIFDGILEKSIWSTSNLTSLVDAVYTVLKSDLDRLEHISATRSLRESLTTTTWMDQFSDLWLFKYPLKYAEVLDSSLMGCILQPRLSFFIQLFLYEGDLYEHIRSRALDIIEILLVQGIVCPLDVISFLIGLYGYAQSPYSSCSLLQEKLYSIISLECTSHLSFVETKCIDGFETSFFYIFRNGKTYSGFKTFGCDIECEATPNSIFAGFLQKFFSSSKRCDIITSLIKRCYSYYSFMDYLSKSDVAVQENSEDIHKENNMSFLSDKEIAFFNLKNVVYLLSQVEVPRIFEHKLGPLNILNISMFLTIISNFLCESIVTTEQDLESMETLSKSCYKMVTTSLETNHAILQSKWKFYSNVKRWNQKQCVAFFLDIMSTLVLIGLRNLVNSKQASIDVNAMNHESKQFIDKISILVMIILSNEEALHHDREADIVMFDKLDRFVQDVVQRSSLEQTNFTLKDVTTRHPKNGEKRLKKAKLLTGNVRVERKAKIKRSKYESEDEDYIE